MLRLRERMGAWLFMAALALAACGDDDDAATDADASPGGGSCEGIAVRSCTTGPTCVEIFSVGADPILTGCTERDDAVVNDAPCPRAGADAACSSGAGLQTCNNLYTYDDADPITPELCTTLGGSYFDP